jgi:hypothetical protein
MSSSTVNSIRNVIAGLMVGYGVASALCYLALEHIWVSTAPAHPDEMLGLIYRYSHIYGHSHSYTYFSEFEATARAKSG